MSTSPFTFGLPKTTTATTNTGFTFGTFNTASSSNSTGTSLFTAPSTAATPAIGFGVPTTKPAMPAFGSPGFSFPSTTAPTNSSNTIIGQPTVSSTGIAQTNLFGFKPTNPTTVTAQPANPQIKFGISSPTVSTAGAPAVTVAPIQPMFKLPAPAGTIHSTVQGTAAAGGGIFAYPSPQQTKTTSAVVNTATLSFGSPVITASTTTSTNQVQPAFGQPSLLGFGVSKTTATTVSTAPLNFGFGIPQTTQPATVSTSISTGGGFQLPQQSLSAAAITTTTPVISTSGSALKFGISSTVGTSNVAIPTVTATTTGQGSSVSVTSTALSVTSLGTKGTSTPTTSVSTVPAKLPTTMTYNQLEELINKWTHELDEQERYFFDEATRINSWDQALLSNSEKIAALYEKVEVCKRDQTQLEQEFELIESQQRELEGLLEVVEKASNDLVPRSQLHSDFEREALLQTASNVDLELGQLLTDLKEMASQVNASADREGALLVKDESASDEKNQVKGGNAAGSVLADSGPGPTAVQQSLTNAAESRTETSSIIKATSLPTQPTCRLHCQQSAIRAARFNSDGQYCITAGGDRTVKLWNPYTCRLLKTYSGHGGEVLDVQASQDNSQLGSGGADCLVIIWDVATGNCLRRWRRHAGHVNAVRFAAPFQLPGTTSSLAGPSPILMSAGVDGMVLVWDVRGRSPYPVQVMHEARDSVTCLAFHRWQIITGSVDRCVRTYDIRKGEMTEDYVGHPVTSVSMTQDCQCILVATQDSTLRLFDAMTGELLNKYTGHVNQTFKMDSILFNGDAHIASGSEDSGLVLVWDFVRPTSCGPLTCLDHTPGGQAWGNLSTPSGDLCHAVAPLVVEAAKSSNFFIHSLSANPAKAGSLLTAGGAFVWLWDSQLDADEVESGEEEEASKIRQTK